MTKVYCADTSCEFCNEKGICTQKEIALSWQSICTVNEGRQEFNRCKTYQKSKRQIELENFMKERGLAL